MDRIRTAVLISGRGSNMMALLRAAQQPDYPAHIVCVISNRPDAAGLEKARTMGVEAIGLDHSRYPSRRKFEQALHKELVARTVEFVACAGFMRVLTPWFVNRWEGRLINIHPSLLPKYKGLHTHQRAIEAGDSEGGATVHWVVSEVDGGQIIEQIAVPIHPDDTADSLQARVLEQELELYPKALKRAATTILNGV
jgi:phosphoribosylglycinamide formyltransferase-1